MTDVTVLAVMYRVDHSPEVKFMNPEFLCAAESYGNSSPLGHSARFRGQAGRRAEPERPASGEGRTANFDFVYVADDTSRVYRKGGRMSDTA